MKMNIGIYDKYSTFLLTFKSRTYKIMKRCSE